MAFFGLSLAVAGFGAFEAYRAEHSHRAAAAGVLTDYGEFAARSFEQRATDVVTQRLNHVFGLVRSNAGFAGGAVTTQCLAVLVEHRGDDSCDCAPTDLTGDWSFYHRLSADPGRLPDEQWGGVAPPPSLRSAVLAATRDHARERYESGWGFAMVQVENGPLVAYTRLVPSPRLDRRLEPGGDTLVYGVVIDLQRMAEAYEWVLDRDGILPTTLLAGRSTRDVVHVDVLDDYGRPVFRSRPGTDHLYPAEVNGRDALGGGLVRASVIPEMADQLVIGGLPSDRTPVLLLIFFLAAALAAASVVQLRREDRLADLRQDFVASVSHELRTPLAQVRLFTETLRLGRARTDEQREWALESIDRETVRLSHLVENILHFSRSERGVHATEFQIVDLAGEVRQAVEAFRPLLPEAKGRIHMDVEGSLAVEVHRDSIRQVLLNYLDNAVRYGRAGQTIRVGAVRPHGRVRIHVDDQGPGVPPAERTRIFEAFHRGVQPEGAAVAGSGIGLSVVGEIADRHGGRAWVEEAPGGGARFVFEVPAAATARPEHFRSAPSDSGTRQPASGVA